MTDLRMTQLWSLKERLGKMVQPLRQEADALFDLEEEMTWDLTPQEKAQSEVFGTWRDRKVRYLQIRRIKRIRNHIRCKVLLLSPRFS